MSNRNQNPSPRRAAGISPFNPDPTIEAAQRDFTDPGDPNPAWALKPKETVCMGCFLVKPCECDDALRPTILTVTSKAGM